MVNQQDVNWERFHAAVCQDGGCYSTGEEEAACERRALEFYQWLMCRSVIDAAAVIALLASLMDDNAETLLIEVAICVICSQCETKLAASRDRQHRLSRPSNCWMMMHLDSVAL